MLAESRAEDSTRTSAVKAMPGDCAATARSIAAHSASGPPDVAGSLSLSITRQWAGPGELTAYALPHIDVATTTANPSCRPRPIYKPRSLAYFTSFIRKQSITVA